MLLLTHPEVKNYVSELNAELLKLDNKPLSRIQAKWLAFILTAMLITSSTCFALFSRLTLGKVTERTLSWFVHSSQAPWQKLLHCSVLLLFKKHNLKNGRLVIDDTERKRAKNTKTLFGVHKIKDKKCNGYIMGQEFVFLVLVTDTVSIVVDVLLYRPDPKISEWRQKVLKQKKTGIPAKLREKQPPRNKSYPSKERLAQKLLCRFKAKHPGIAIKSILFDNAFLTRFLLAHAKRLFPTSQIISKLRCNQLVKASNKSPIAVSKYFSSKLSISREITIRGTKKYPIHFIHARLFVASLKKKLHVVAVKYDKEKEYRFLAATELTWRAEDLIREFGFRWLIEVVFSDWKLYEGFGKAASQRGADGVGCVLTLSLLLDGFLNSHKEQLVLAQLKQPLRTVGSMCRKIQFEVFLQFLEEIINSENPRELFDKFKHSMDLYVDMRSSDKHMSGRILPHTGPPL